jgi:energy-coupling factor transporter ATP-binding protein EcfA2
MLQNQLNNQSENMKIINLYGEGGIGKTSLLQAFGRFIEQSDGGIFLMLDSNDFIHSPRNLTQKIMQLLETKLTQPLSVDSMSFKDSIQILRKYAESHRIVIAVDTYEQMGDLDRWFRELFVRQLPQQILIIISGRFPLAGEWTHSPAWRELIHQIPLSEFTLDQTSSFLKSCSIQDKNAIQDLWQFTKGHPLTLTLAITTFEKGVLRLSDTEERSKLFQKLLEIWLKEVPDQILYDLIEAGGILRHFDQFILADVLQKDIPALVFNQLISLSFVKRKEQGWALHDLVRDAIRFNLKQHNHKQYRWLSQQCASHYLQHIGLESHSEWDIAEFFYHLEDEIIQSSFFQGVGNDNGLYLVSVDEHNFILKVGYESARLLKNSAGETLGLSVVVPIHEQTIGHLMKLPVSRAYFRGLSHVELKEYTCQKIKTPAGLSVCWTVLILVIRFRVPICFTVYFRYCFLVGELSLLHR